MQIERRRSPRVPCVTKARELREDGHRSARVTDICEDGVYLQRMTDHDLHVGQLIRIQFELPKNLGVVEGLCEVVTAGREVFHEAGAARFRLLRPGDRDRIRRYVRELTSQQAA